MKKTFISILLLGLFVRFSLSAADKTIYIWKNVPGMEKQKSVLYMHEARGENKTDTAVIICPGGSYHHLGLYNEGYCSAAWFSKNGVTAFTLKYRTNEEGYNYPAMLEDVQRAVQLVRENSESYGINPCKIGVIGYSAGGHLAGLCGESGNTLNELSKLGIETTVSLRPDFVVPVYPVVSMQEDIGHKWSRKSFLGSEQSQERRNRFSLELNVPEDMPPAYIVAAKDDDVVDYRNSLRFYAALEEKGIQNCRLTVYEWGKHGFGMKNGPFMKAFHWNEGLKEWMTEIGMW